MVSRTLIVLCCVSLVGCAGGNTTADRAAPVRTVGAPGPVVIERVPREPAEPDGSAPGIEADESVASEGRQPVRVFGEGEEVPRREDGRPTWWLDSNERHGERTRFCAEAIAGTILEARRAAVRRVEAMSARLDGSGDIEYLRIWVWPIRATGDIRPRYAVFVMAEVATPE
ncbi:MAG: hypothetical protein RLN60_05045 [Phycisphaerales bacterium]